jgi:hypothetical protein
MLLLSGFYLIAFLLYFGYLIYLFSTVKVKTQSLFEVKNQNTHSFLISKFYLKYDQICFYDRNGTLSYIPEVIKLVEYIDYCGNYNNLVTPLDIIKQLKDIDVEYNLRKLILQLKSLDHNHDMDVVIAYLSCNDFIFNFKVLNISEININRIYYKALRMLNYIIEYDYFCFLLSKENRKKYLNKFIIDLFNSNNKDISIEQIDSFSGSEFEFFCAFIFSQLNYSVEHTKTTYDFGADLIIKKQGISYAVQCKRYSDVVSNKAIQEVVSSMNVYNCSKSIVITNSTFSSSAMKLAKHNHVLLIDRKKLIEILLNIRRSPMINNSLLI